METPGDIFSYEGLRRFLLEASREVNIFPLRDWHGRPGLILRHDVDFAIEPAMRLAQLEMECEIRSTFFVMVTNEWYNPSAPTTRSMLRELTGNGFEVGLHFDVQAVPDEGEKSARKRLEVEAEILALAAETEVTSVSLHHPSVSGRYSLFKGYNNAYDPGCFGPDCYVSDSRRHFRGNLSELIVRAKAQTTQLLLHPLHYSASGGGYDEVLYDTMCRLFGLDEDWRENSTYVSFIKEGLLPHFLAKLNPSPKS